jgi:hypothetical protein
MQPEIKEKGWIIKMPDKIAAWEIADKPVRREARSGVDPFTLSIAINPHK